MLLRAADRKAQTLKEALTLLWAEAGRFVKWRLGVAFVIVAVTSALTALSPVYLKFAMDAMTAATPRNPTGWLALYVGTTWLARTLGEARTVVHAQADRRMFRGLCNRLCVHIMRLPLRYHFDRQTGVVVGTLTQAVQGSQMLLQTLVLTLLPVAIEIGTVAVVLIQLDQAGYLIVFVVGMACYGGAFGWGALHITSSARSASASQAEAMGVLTDSLLNYEAVKYFTGEEMVRRRLDASLVRNESDWMRFYGMRALIGLVIATIFATFLGVCAFYAAHQVQTGAMTIGTFVLIHTYIFRLTQPLEMMGYAVQQISQGLAFLEKLVGIFRQRTETGGNEGCGTFDGPGRLEFRNVSLAYREDSLVLRDVSFEIQPGRTLGIVGASGAGKSTLVRLLMRLVEPNQGEVLLDSVPLRQIPLQGLRQAIAVVPQDTLLFNESIAYNIAFGKPDSDQAEIERAARMANLHDFIASLPDRYQTRVGERGVKLSGGERQRLAIARAAIKRPRIYVFDEATSSLDSRTEAEIMRNLRELSRDCTTLIIAHRLSTVVHADEIVVLDSGIVAERGTHSSLLSQAGKYARLWLAQQAARSEQECRPLRRENNVETTWDGDER